MAKIQAVLRRSSSLLEGDEIPPHLTVEEVNRLSGVYQEWFDGKPNIVRARH